MIFCADAHQRIFFRVICVVFPFWILFIYIFSLWAVPQLSLVRNSLSVDRNILRFILVHSVVPLFMNPIKSSR